MELQYRGNWTEFFSTERIGWSFSRELDRVLAYRRKIC